MDRKIVSIEFFKNRYQGMKIIFNDKEEAVFTKWGGTIYTQTSPGVLKKTLIEFKRDLKKYDWNIEILKKLWVEDIKHGME